MIRIEGARVHNLKNISLEIPRNKLVAITGPSGSGKSSLAFDTIFAEGQRQFIESLSVDVRKFLRQMERPDVDSIRGLQPTIAVDQRGRSNNPRSTVATLTEIYDYLRLLYARLGLPHCVRCGRPIRRQSAQQILEDILSLPEGTRLMLLAPIIRHENGDHRESLRKIMKAGFVRARIDGELHDIEHAPTIDPYLPHDIEAVIDRIVLKDGIRSRLAESLQLALRHGEGTVVSVHENSSRVNQGRATAGDWTDISYNTRNSCPYCNVAFVELEPRTFSFNSPYGACPTCEGTGIAEPLQPNALPEERECSECGGRRLRPEARGVIVGDKRIHELCALPLDESLEFVRNLEFPSDRQSIAKPILEQLVNRLEFLNRVGLDYLSLDRPTDTLSGGEFQRVRLAAGLGNRLVGVCYVLDEPSIGLHPRDNRRLIDALRELQRQGNTVLVVEHDEEIMREADCLIDLGPGAGIHGGNVVAEWRTENGEWRVKESKFSTNKRKQELPNSQFSILNSQFSSLTAEYLNGEKGIPVPKERRPVDERKMLRLEGASLHNLKNISVSFPLGVFVCVTGVSGSGKSSLVNETLVPLVREFLSSRNGARGPALSGVEHLDKLIEVDQSSLGRSARSNPATLCGVFDEIRKIFASTKDAKQRGYKANRFSFNATGGRCEECQGYGTRRIEMGFLPELYAVCPECNGKRFNRQTLEIMYKGKSIADVLDLSVDDAATFFKNFPSISRILESLRNVGLGYPSLGQPATTLSGGEMQRIKLATELAKPDTGRTLYVLDEPTSGLHAHDIRLLLDVLQKLVDLGNTVIVIEHDLDVMKSADWIVDMGPEGGKCGGMIIATGTPERIASLPDNPTGRFLREKIPC